jgi:hypothetical protein
MNHFLGQVLIDAVIAGDVPKFLRRNILSSDFLSAFSEQISDLTGRDARRARRFITALMPVLKQSGSLDRTRRNSGSILVATLSTEDAADNLLISNLDIDEAVITRSPSYNKIDNSLISQLDITGSDISWLRFTNTTIITMIVDGRTRASPTLPIPTSLQIVHPNGTQDVRVKSLIEEWLARHGRTSLKTPTNKSTAPPALEPPIADLLNKACRINHYWLKRSDDRRVNAILNHPHWDQLSRLLLEQNLLERSST